MPPGIADMLSEVASLAAAIDTCAGGGRLGLERDAFVLAGGVEVMFREKGFVGFEKAASFAARDLS